MYRSRMIGFLIFVVFFSSSCASVNSQKVNSENTNVLNSNRKTDIAGAPSAITPTPSPDSYEIDKKGSEELNAEPLPQGSSYRQVKSITREQIRNALIQLDLGQELRNGKVGGGKIVHFSHTCDFFVDNQPFHVIEAPMIIQLASFYRRINHILIYDGSMKLIHNLSADDPLFCDGNRLVFNDPEMVTSPNNKNGKEIKGNVLIFTNNAKNITGRAASLNFYRFRDLIH